MGKLLNRFHLLLVYVIFCVIFGIFLYLPLLVVFVFSLTDSESSTEQVGFFSRWREAHFKSKDVIDTTANSLATALCAATAVVAKGTLSVLKRLYLWLVYAFFYVPLLIVFVYSFNDGKYSTKWVGFSWRWYEALFKNKAILDAALNSLTVAVCAATVATIIGGLSALSLSRYRFPGRKPLFISIFMLTVSPDIVMGISLLIMFIALKIKLGFVTLLIAHTTLCAPFVTVTVMARLAEFDEHLIEAARDLGASEARAFWHILLPLTAPAVAAGWLLSFTLSMDDVLISTFVTGSTFEVLPVRIYSMVKLGVKPDINALSAIMFVLTLVLVFTAQGIMHVRKKP